MSVGKRTSPVSFRAFPVPLSMLLRSGNTGLTGAPDGAGPTWGRAPAPFSPPSPANRPRAAALVSQQLCPGVLPSDRDPRGPCWAGGPGRDSAGRPRNGSLPCAPHSTVSAAPRKPPQSSQLPWEAGPAGGARPTPWLQKLRLREVRQRDPGQKGGVHAAGVWSASTFRRAARAGGVLKKSRRPRRGRGEPRSERGRGPRTGGSSTPPSSLCPGSASGCDHVTSRVTAPPGEGLGAGARSAGSSPASVRRRAFLRGPFAPLDLPAL